MTKFFKVLAMFLVLLLGIGLYAASDRDDDRDKNKVKKPPPHAPATEAPTGFDNDFMNNGSVDGPTFKFKKQWGALPHPAAWQYASPSGSVSDARPDNPKYRRLIQLWQKLPVGFTEWLGPMVVRGIP